MKPLCIDLFCGLGGWSEGFLSEGWECIGFDIERHDYGNGTYPGQLVLQDVLTLHGSQFRNADCIVASPPCQKYSYMAQPWSRAKALAKWYRDEPARQEELNALFNACFRIQLEATQAAGRFIPLIVENVRGAQPWVGKAMAQFGSYFLWGDVRQVGNRLYPAHDLRFGSPFDLTVPGRGRMKYQADCGPRMWSDREVVRLNDRMNTAMKGHSGTWFGIQSNGVEYDQAEQNPVSGRKCPEHHDTFAKDGRPCGKLTNPRYSSEGTKQGGNWWHDPESMTRRFSSKSDSRKAASAMIAKIPFPLSSWVARVMKPCFDAASAPSSASLVNPSQGFMRVSARTDQLWK